MTNIASVPIPRDLILSLNAEQIRYLDQLLATRNDQTARDIREALARHSEQLERLKPSKKQ